MHDPVCSFVQALGKITADGVFLEQLETDPSKYMPEIDESAFSTQVVQVSDAHRLSWSGGHGGHPGQWRMHVVQVIDAPLFVTRRLT